MKRSIIAIATLLFLIRPGLGNEIWHLEAPGDDYKLREATSRGPAVCVFADKYNQIQRKWLWRLDPSELAAACGPKLHSLPPDHVLPLFEGNCLGFSGAFSRGEIDKSHVDFYRVGDIAYLELHYERNGESLKAAVLWFQSDADFVSLKSLDDLTRRLDWDLQKFEHFEKWLDQHLPK